MLYRKQEMQKDMRFDAQVKKKFMENEVSIYYTNIHINLKQK